LVIGMAVLASAAQANQNFTVVLHARTPSGLGSCTVADLPTCQTGSDPVTQIAASIDFRAYIFVNNYTNIQALQTCFVWPADWHIAPNGPPSVFGCRANQLNASEPADPGGPSAGTLATAFDCVTGPTMTPIARIDFQAGAGGCLTQVNPAQGTMRIEVVDCLNASTSFDASDPLNLPRLGTICIGANGINACGPLPVEAATWGRIKASFKQ
jgi:hypothetical protein